MRTPGENAEGYAGTAVSNVTALGESVRFMVMHGVADDNVHYQNTLRLLERLDAKGVRGYDAHLFTDSNHGIYFHGASKALYNREFHPLFFIISLVSPLVFGREANGD